MKLTELNPKFAGYTDDGSIKIGILFDCPCCKKQRLHVPFSNPIDKNGWLLKGVTRPHFPNEWKREGDTFESITLNPSIDFSKIGHWHGSIINGQIQ